LIYLGWLVGRTFSPDQPSEHNYRRDRSDGHSRKEFLHRLPPTPIPNGWMARSNPYAAARAIKNFRPLRLVIFGHKLASFRVVMSVMGT